MAQQTAELNAAVTQYIRDTFDDGLTRATPLWNHLSSKEGRKKQVGGIYLQFPIKLIKNATSGFISGTNAVVSADPSIQLQYGILNWKYHNFNTNFTLQDYNVAMGSSEAALDFFKGKSDGAIADAMREFAAASWGSSASAPLAFEGLQDICAASGTTYAGLNDTDYADATAYLPYTSTDAIVNYSAINKMIDGVRVRMQQASTMNKKVIGLMGQPIYSKYKSAVQNQQIFMNESDVVKTGFTGFQVGDVTFYMDADAPGTGTVGSTDNWCVIIPTDVMKLYYNFGFENKSPFDTDVQIPLQPIKSVQKYFSGNIVCTNRRLIAVNKSFTA